MGIKTVLGQVFEPIVNSEKPPHHMGIKTALKLIWRISIASEKPPHHMGIKTFDFAYHLDFFKTLKNLPTTWGLRHPIFTEFDVGTPLKNLPTTWGLRRAICSSTSAVPATLKNLPATRG